MSARVQLPQIDHSPSVIDERFVRNKDFLRNTVETLERLQEESEAHGRHLLASLLAITRGEAEDDLKTGAKIYRLRSRDLDRNDGAAEMARKLACRGAAPAEKEPA